MALLAAGLIRFLKGDLAHTVLCLAGGLVLAWMGIGLVSSVNALRTNNLFNARYGPFATGLILTAANPYFLLWWATIGLKLSSDAWQRGPLVFMAFAVVHWLCDAAWLTALAWASFKGGSLIGQGPHRYILLIAGAIMLVFAVRFLIDGFRTLKMANSPIDRQE
jgi:threonine/homoserine/homoserine lactone efflux protein